MMRDIGLIGPLNVDLILSGQAPFQNEELIRWAGPSEVQLCAAGSAGYIAQDLARFGFRTSLVSILSDDPFGDAVLRILNAGGLDTRHVSRQEGTLSGIGIYMLLFGSKKRPLTYRMPTHLPWPRPFTPDQRQFLLEEHRHLHCAGYLHFPDMWNEELADLFREAKHRGLTTSLDPQFVLIPVQTPWLEPLRAVLPYTDLLLLDEDEAREIAGENDLHQAARFLLRQGPKTVVIKCGRQGSLVCEDQAIHDCPAESVPEEEIVDSIGAGDAFDCGIIYGFLNGWDSSRSQKFATLAAASTLKAAGGTNSLAPVEVLLQMID